MIITSIIYQANVFILTRPSPLSSSSLFRFITTLCALHLDQLVMLLFFARKQNYAVFPQAVVFFFL